MNPVEAGPASNRIRWMANAAVFVSGACIMIVELLAGRVISRHVGQSLYTWTAIIGVVLAGILAGNYAGGMLADRRPPRRLLALLFLLAAAGCFAVRGLNDLAGHWSLLRGQAWPARIVLHVLITFLLPALLLGTIGPVAARMAVGADPRTGRAVGDVYAWGSLGAILGTFLAGFVLIPSFGVTAIVGGVSGLLAVTGLLYAAASLH
ncbi:MAG TPA: fused MFS/spermidine synthase [Kiritimatiellia bacterium]|nr:fused MFS/spermidine synthase [Kiritimatiellia bacterium]HRZ11524.1 fused MFS/spermidine synthase [Kiritimatiellia bacterium]HSA16925.1 fused MFS/spermidine synthase [Kiritimatiellia bacterium]